MSAQVFEALAQPALNAVRRDLPSAAAPSGDRRAWQREMEKAQADRWFHGPPSARTPSPVSAVPAPVGMEQGPSLRAAGAPGTAMPPAAAIANRADPGGAAQPGGGGSLGAMASTDGAAPFGPAGTGPAATRVAVTPRVTPRVGPPMAPHTAVASRPASSSSDIEPSSDAPQRVLLEGRLRVADSGPRQTVRVHVEDSPAGLSVWLGVDGGVLAPGLWSALRHQLAARGVRIARVVCNGQQVQGLDEPAAATPHPR